ncbi:MAG: PTS sugar transporter subunit IIA [Verrucomicrobiae bacterium]|nr:PTS sugar transporter subunit IIA [Verrucomicrobiae bacterium]
MQLSATDAARALDVPEKTLYRWLKQGLLPAHAVHDQYRFNRDELLEWATARGIVVSERLMADDDTSWGRLSLAAAIELGGVHRDVEGADRDAVLRAVVARMPFPEEVDRDALLQVLLARESMGSTGIGNGIAIPHVRSPIVLHVPRAMVALCFLREAIAFGAVDGKPVHTVFAIVSPSVKGHLHLLSLLARGLQHPGFAAALARQAAADEILAQCRLVEAASTKGAKA